VRVNSGDKNDAILFTVSRQTSKLCWKINDYLNLASEQNECVSLVPSSDKPHYLSLHTSRGICAVTPSKHANSPKSSPLDLCAGLLALTLGESLVKLSPFPLPSMLEAGGEAADSLMNWLPAS
jgi:hypothetical protein